MIRVASELGQHRCAHFNYPKPFQFSQISVNCRQFYFPLHVHDCSPWIPTDAASCFSSIHVFTQLLPLWSCNSQLLLPSWFHNLKSSSLSSHHIPAAQFFEYFFAADACNTDFPHYLWDQSFPFLSFSGLALSTFWETLLKIPTTKMQKYLLRTWKLGAMKSVLCVENFRD